ncbi:DUF167 family protein [Microvirga puerhi]|uniref:UPF0235 protein K9B37_05880 n=1 Tax=Microvirga puerhi TaxID=2876078 RepID=A0ABS7VJW0_9HYPH|nr:DUF167 family protein [Microvirga puerhi]MBZ6075816.1 DUF167 family protein [Microvirga puerhi]
MPCRVLKDGLEIRVRVTPRGGRDAIEGIAHLSDGTDVLKVRVRAVPENGAANDAVGRLLAKAFGVPASTVRLAAGSTARLKTFIIEGEAQALAARFSALTGQN